MTPDEFVRYVDAFLSARKTLVGADEPLIWGQTRTTEGKRLRLPLLMDGEARGESLVLDVFPDRNPPTYHLMVVIEPTVCRVDYDPGAVHPNDVFGPISLPVQVEGPHYHSWPVNRYRFKTASYAVPLGNAVLLPKAPMSFDNVLRWFCTDNNIELPPKHTIELPPRTKLL